MYIHRAQKETFKKIKSMKASSNLSMLFDALLFTICQVPSLILLCYVSHDIFFEGVKIEENLGNSTGLIRCH